MKRLDLRPGDGFLVKTGSWIGRRINSVQAFYSKDKQSTYNHCGIIVNSSGVTLEALGKVCHKNIYTTYKKCPILIVRHKKMTQELFDEVYPQIAKHKNDRYPYWRLLFFCIPGMAEHINLSKLLVCSELFTKYFVLCRLMKKYLGVNVDDLHDKIKNSDNWQIIYQDKLINSK